MAYPESPLGVRIRIAPEADLTAVPDSYSWEDVTPDVSFRDDRPIVIKAGAADEQQESNADTALTFRNFDSRCVEADGDAMDPADRGRGLGMEGRYTSDNPESDLYPSFDLGLPVEIATDSGSGYEVEGVMFLGSAVDSWPGSTASDNYALTTVTLRGLLSRLTQARDPRSALGRTLWPEASALRPTDYWPMESTSVGVVEQAEWPNLSALMPAATSVPTLPGTQAGPAGSYSIPLFYCPTDTTYLAGRHRLSPSALTGNGVHWRTGGIVGGIVPDDDRVCSTYVKIISTAGDAREVWVLMYSNRLNGLPVPGECGYDVFVKDSGGSTIMSGTTYGLNLNPFDGVPHYLEVELVQVGGAQGIQIFLDNVLVIEDTVIAVTGLACPREYVVGERAHTIFGAHSTNNAGLSIMNGHVYYTNMHPSFGGPDVPGGAASTGWPGEMAHERIERLCAEEAVPCVPLAGGSRSTVMGRQPSDALVPLLRECEKADYGILDDHLGYVDFIPSTFMYNRATDLTIDGADGELVMPWEPVTDDQRAANDVTCSHSGGGPGYRFVDTAHVALRGRWPKAITPNVLTSAQDANQASWLVHLGTVKGKRYPTVALDFFRKPTMIAPWHAVATPLGMRITTVNPPRQHTKGTIEHQVRGYVMTLTGRRKWTVVCNTVPYLPSEVFVVESGSGNRSRLDNGSCILDANRSSSATSLSVLSSNVRWIDSATYSAMFPFDIEINGEQLRVTAITGTGLTQTMTVTRSINGVSRAHLMNSRVRLWRPAAIAL